MRKNRVHKFIVDETWRNINKIAKHRSLTVLYRDGFTEEEVTEAKSILLRSWYSVNAEILGDESEKVLLVELKQTP